MLDSFRKLRESYSYGAGELEIDYKARTIKVNGYEIKEGDWISLNGSTGEVYLGQVATQAANLDGDFGQLMELAGKYSKMNVRANADTPRDAEQAFALAHRVSVFAVQSTCSSRVTVSRLSAR